MQSPGCDTYFLAAGQAKGSLVLYCSNISKQNDVHTLHRSHATPCWASRCLHCQKTTELHANASKHYSCERLLPPVVARSPSQHACYIDSAYTLLEAQCSTGGKSTHSLTQALLQHQYIGCSNEADPPVSLWHRHLAGWQGHSGGWRT